MRRAKIMKIKSKKDKEIEFLRELVLAAYKEISGLENASYDEAVLLLRTACYDSHKRLIEYYQRESQGEN